MNAEINVGRIIAKPFNFRFVDACVCSADTNISLRQLTATQAQCQFGINIKPPPENPLPLKSIRTFIKIYFQILMLTAPLLLL